MTVTIRTIHRFDGPNVWSPRPVTRLRLDLATLPAAITGGRYVAALTALLPRLADPRAHAAPLTPVPFAEEHDIAGLLATLIVNLQRLAGLPVTFYAVAPSVDDALVDIVVEHRAGSLVVSAAHLAGRLVAHLLTSDEREPRWLAGAVKRLSTQAASFIDGTAEGAITAEAERRGIPVSRMDPAGHFIELGTGAYRQRVQGSNTSRTSSIAVALLRDKSVTNHYLRAAGLPVPDGRVVRTVEQALAVAREIGYPVVVKPVDLGGSAGVAVDLRDEEAVRAHAPRAAELSTTHRVLIERYIPGDLYRVTVINGRIFAISQRLRARVTGDGLLPIRALIERANADPRRGWHENDPMRAIPIDETTLDQLTRQGLTLDDIPAAGQTVLLRPTARTHDGGVAIDRTADLHPDNEAIFLQAAHTLGVDVCTMDVIAREISQSIWESSGTIIEVNTHSGLRMEQFPSVGTPRDPGPPIIDMLFPQGQPVRAPVIAVMGDAHRAATTCREIARIMTAAGHAVGLASAGRVTIAGRATRLGADEARGPAGARTLLDNAGTGVAVIEVDPVRLVAEGLGFDYCDVAVILGLSTLRTPAGRAVELVVTDLIERGGTVVKHADESGAVDLPGELMLLIAADAAHARVRAHTAQGGRAVVSETTADGHTIVLIAGAIRTEIGQIAREVPDLLPLLAVVAAGIARELSLDIVRAAITTPA